MAETTKGDGSSYLARLLSSSATKNETAAQCKDMLSTGTDSTGNKFAFICWSLVANPEIYLQLRKEIEVNAAVMAHLQTLSCIEGVVKEALRLSMAIPCRPPRVVVPKEGWTFDGCYFPSGTNVDIRAFEFHLNPKTFPRPHKFLPDRWLEASAEMHRDWVPFGKGARGCIARNLALTELFIATEKKSSFVCAQGCKNGRRTDRAV